MFIVTASPPPYSKMTSEATCGTISELDLTKLSFKFSTLASLQTTQSTSSEDYPKGAISLVHEFRAKFPLLQLFTLGRHPPNLHTLGSTTHIWIGGLLYVDDLVLMSTCPRELQAMLHVSQQWSTRSRMRINTGKTKIMAFFETLALLPPGVDNIGPAQSCIPFTCTHSSQLPTLARTLFTKSSSSNLSALAGGGYGSHFQGIVGEDTRSNIVRHTGYRCECY